MASSFRASGRLMYKPPPFGVLLMFIRSLSKVVQKERLFDPRLSKLTQSRNNASNFDALIELHDFSSRVTSFNIRIRKFGTSDIKSDRMGFDVKLNMLLRRPFPESDA